MKKKIGKPSDKIFYICLIKKWGKGGNLSTTENAVMNKKLQINYAYYKYFFLFK